MKLLSVVLLLPLALAFSANPNVGFVSSPSLLARKSVTTARSGLGLRTPVAGRSLLSSGRVSSPLGTVMMAAKKCAVGLVGTGVVGGELYQQLEATKASVMKNSGLDISVVAVSTFKDGKSWMMTNDKGISMADYEKALADPKAGEDGDFKKMAEIVKGAGSHGFMIDCTASEEVSSMYLPWLEAGLNVVTPNKKVGSGDLDRYSKCKKAMADKGTQWGYETTVGAGLPIVRTIQTDLMATGDSINKIEGIFSGTLSYIFNTYKPGMKFSDVIEDAKNKGFTEPDPRDDLSGTDVQRKVVILARECGLNVEMKDVPVDSLVPVALKDWQPPAGKKTADAFIEEMKAFDDEKAKQIKAAMDKNMVLRYVGVVDLKAKKASVTLAEYPNTHPFAGTQWADNICAFSTERYQPQPLVIQGPGAGAAVTAAGVYADMIRIALSL